MMCTTQRQAESIKKMYRISYYKPCMHGSQGKSLLKQPKKTGTVFLRKPQASPCSGWRSPLA